MYNSKNIDDLRADMAANCRVFLALCGAENLPVLVTGTVRDDAYQLFCYEQGYSKAKRPAFHAQGVGLAFDFCKNIKGHEFDDNTFFSRCGAIGERVGFAWGGRWTSFPDRPHLQWSGPKHDFKSADIWAGRLPPTMPLYRPAQPEKEDDSLTKEQFEALYDEVNPLYIKLEQVPTYWQADAKALIDAGAIQGDGTNSLHIRMEQLQTAVIARRYGDRAKK